MYSDPSQIRKHKVTLYLNDAEADLVEAINNYRGGEKAPLLRELLIESAHRALAGDVNVRPDAQQNEVAQYALFRS
ncbi:MAG TPA: hypothetical protein VFA81_10895 [Burkholderiales bacterium]|nr:hypothetical protein [Burkholderiales bacterium]